jgi:thiol-disulfide isomerase/thioredoxin
MKWLLCILVSLGSAGSALSSAVGDTYDQVIAEKGKPTSHIEAGAMQILKYPDASIKLKDNVVVSIRAPEPVSQAGGAPAPRPLPPAVGPAAQIPEPFDPNAKLTWSTDYDGSLERAKLEHKHVLLFFTGSDWCGWCKKLNREILTTGEFVEYAQGKLILVELDYPRQKPQSYEVKVQNRMLESRYSVTGFPTVVILDYTGKSVARLGYQAGGPGPFISQIQALGD